MDPVSMIVAALAAGAAAGLKPVAAEAVKDAYHAVKRLIEGKYGNVDLAPLEARPESEAKRASLAEDLADAGAGEDGELLARAGELVEAVRAHDAEAGRAVGVDLEEVKAEFLRVQRVTSDETGVRVRRSSFEGGIEIGDVRAGTGGGSTENPS